MNALVCNKNEKPWGCFYVTHDSSISKSKLIVVDQGNSISYQYHRMRSEDWIVLGGKGIVTIEGDSFEVECGAHVRIEKGQKHRIRCTEGPLTFVEVQTGEYFGEDDIVRLEDEYGRI